ncbi:SDR family NAD(P)-dependent oxidoreductase [Frankia sp. AgB32]|uniref:SDR family NAD(P)-dependent oxidoreductase n=1 Tax=Frankia sp. AgB32 TaxID=631119 RepID=UPI00200E744B|nr:SDR family NAD(P)-dependent oxidoreductase [Frankia sp. AgB32]MCK9893642.1 SDR family oxidoreductase [Frankia sp. AgB32]
MLTRVADLREPAQCRAAVAVAEFGRLGVLDNVAGVLRMGHVTDVTEEEYRLTFTVNPDAYFFCAQAATPHLLETGGNIVNVASNAGTQGGAGRHPPACPGHVRRISEHPMKWWRSGCAGHHLFVADAYGVAITPVRVASAGSEVAGGLVERRQRHRGAHRADRPGRVVRGGLVRTPAAPTADRLPRPDGDPGRQR